MVDGWAYCDLGFNTQRLLWTLEFYTAGGQPDSYKIALSVELLGGITFQYAWPEANPPAGRQVLWHVRQRFLREHVTDISSNMTERAWVGFGNPPGNLSEPVRPLESDVVAVEVSYDLETSKGRVDLIKEDGKFRRLPERWVMTEGLTQRTYGTYPRIRLRSEAADVAGLVITGTTCTIVGRKVV